jgi:phasin
MKFNLPKMEVPEGFREMAEKSVAQARDTFENVKAAAEIATELLKDSYVTASKGATDYNLKVMEIACANTNTAIDYAGKLLVATSLSEFVEISTAHAQKQYEAMTAQSKELSELAQKVTTEIAKPLAIGATKAFNNKLAR